MKPFGTIFPAIREAVEGRLTGADLNDWRRTGSPRRFVYCEASRWYPEQIKAVKEGLLEAYLGTPYDVFRKHVYMEVPGLAFHVEREHLLRTIPSTEEVVTKDGELCGPAAIEFFTQGDLAYYTRLDRAFVWLCGDVLRAFRETRKLLRPSLWPGYAFNEREMRDFIDGAVDRWAEFPINKPIDWGNP